MKAIILTFICLWLLSNTTLLKPKSIDFRDTFCGNYACKRLSYRANSKLDGIIKDSTSLILNVSKSRADSSILISLTEGSFELTYKNGGFGYYSNNTRCSAFFKSGDSLFITYKKGLSPQWTNYIGKK